MGCVNSTDQREPVKSHEDNDQNKEKTSKEVNLVLFGCSETGKSTLLKQIKLICEGGFTEEEKKEYTSVVVRNTVQCMLAILRDISKQNLQFSNSSTTEDVKHFFQLTQFKEEEEEEDPEPPNEISQDLAALLKRLWTDECVQHYFRSSNNPQVKDSYFLERLDIISQPSYIPSQDDILRARAKTTEIIESHFMYQNFRLTIYDVGGEKSCRIKWIQLYQRTTAIIFCASMTDYNEFQVENAQRKNKLVDTLDLFGKICNNKYLNRKPIILLLNKKDIFKEKIKSVGLSTCFPEYNGEGTYEQTAAYMQLQFEKKNRMSEGTKEIYVHVISATNSDDVRFVFEEMTNVIIREHLKNCELC